MDVAGWWGAYAAVVVAAIILSLLIFKPLYKNYKESNLKGADVIWNIITSIAIVTAFAPIVNFWAHQQSILTKNQLDNDTVIVWSSVNKILATCDQKFQRRLSDGTVCGVVGSVEENRHLYPEILNLVVKKSADSSIEGAESYFQNLKNSSKRILEDGKVSSADFDRDIGIILLIPILLIIDRVAKHFRLAREFKLKSDSGK